MKFKSLLCAVAMLATTLAAYAFPSYSLSPASGKSFDAGYAMANINLEFGWDDILVVKDGAKANLYNEETGDEATSTVFKVFMGQYIMINFDDTEFISNGEWTLTIPAGSFTANDEENPVITATYTLDDPANGSSQTFPEIKLVSTDPAAGAKLRALGGSQFPEITTPGTIDEKMHVMKIVTDNDAAVNHIEWYFYDVTNGDSDSTYIAQGNDNRYDQNRFPGYMGDTWADGLWISIAHDSQALLEGHKYRMDISFYGIGYDIEKNQYPTPTQLKQSLELTTSLYFEGQTPATEYSPYTVESVSPNPDNYTIESVEFGRFTMVYTGPVKPVSFVYAQVTGSTPSAGTYTAIDPDADGYAKAWEFVFDRSVLENALGALNVSIQAQDANGLYVKGNAEYDQDNFTYTTYWLCNLGADKLISIAPEDGVTVEVLSTITIGNDADKVMALSYATADKPYITTKSRDVVRELGDPVFSEDLKTATWTFDPITESGVYVIVIPNQYMNMGEEFDSTTSNATEFSYTVEAAVVEQVVYDLQPVSVVPAENSEVEEISTVTVTFGSTTFYTLNPATYDFTPATLFKVTANGDETVESMVASDNMLSDFWSPTIYDYNFTKVTEAGTYKLVIPAGSFGDASFDESGQTSGHANPELTYTFTIKATSAIDVIVAGENETYTVYGLDGVLLLEGADKADLSNLNKGLYIVNGKKVVIK